MDANIYLRDKDGNPIGTAANPLVVFPATGSLDAIVPLNTKGDLLTFSTGNVRLGVGTDGYPLVANSSATEGIAWEQLTEAGISLSDVTTLDVSTSKHGFCPKAPNDTAKYLRGDGTWAAVSGAGIGDVTGPASSIDNAISRFDGTSGKAIQNSLITISDEGTVNIPSGQTYNINGSPHTHLGSDITSAVSNAVDADTLDGSHASDFATASHNHDSTYASIAKGVTNGDSHDHVGGDGAAITESALSLSDITTNNASTTKHGFCPKATAPSSGIRNIVAIDNGETTYKNAALVDSTNPEPLGTVSSGSQLVAARRDHVHPNYTSSGVGLGIGKGSAPSYLLEIKGTSTTDLPTYGDEFLDGDNWTGVGTDWT